MLIREWMEAAPEAVRPNTGAHEGLERLLQHGLRALPVVDERGRLCGVVRDHALLRVAAQGARERHDVKVRNVMESRPVRVEADDSLRRAAELFAAGPHLDGLPVTEAGRLCGWLSRATVLRALRLPTSSAWPSSPVSWGAVRHDAHPTERTPDPSTHFS